MVASSHFTTEERWLSLAARTAITMVTLLVSSTTVITVALMMLG